MRIYLIFAFFCTGCAGYESLPDTSRLSSVSSWNIVEGRSYFLLETGYQCSLQAGGGRIQSFRERIDFLKEKVAFAGDLCNDNIQLSPNNQFYGRFSADFSTLYLNNKQYRYFKTPPY